VQLEAFKNRYKVLQASLAEDFLKNPDLVVDLVQQRSDAIDTLLNDIWQDFEINNALCLAAVGGYGRRELHLHSDIDLLILIPDGTHDIYQQSLSKFLAKRCWSNLNGDCVVLFACQRKMTEKTNHSSSALISCLKIKTLDLEGV
jgi:UTP:GlnB (protein PII) uridylyltransferase